jgi:catechol 2,3-dioxygenase-like lactoylglutathione lyase family enzyme
MSNNAPVFHGLNLVVRDMDAALAFYRRLGLTILDTEPQWEHQHRNAVTPEGFDLDFDSIEFAKQWNRGWPGGAGGATGVIGFTLATREAVDATYADLVGAGYRAQQEPYDAFWGARYAVVEDPDGNGVGLMSPIDAARRSMPTPP